MPSTKHNKTSITNNEKKRPYNEQEIYGDGDDDDDDGEDDGGNYDNPASLEDHDVAGATTDSKVVSRREANRLHALKSRQRSKQLLQELQQTIQQYNYEKMEYERQNAILTAQVEVLRQQNLALLQNQNQQPRQPQQQQQQHNQSSANGGNTSNHGTSNMYQQQLQPSVLTSSSTGATGTALPMHPFWLPQQQQHQPNSQQQPPFGAMVPSQPQSAQPAAVATANNANHNIMAGVAAAALQQLLAATSAGAGNANNLSNIMNHPMFLSLLLQAASATANTNQPAPSSQPQPLPNSPTPTNSGSQLPVLSTTNFMGAQYPNQPQQQLVATGNGGTNSISGTSTQRDTSNADSSNAVANAAALYPTTMATTAPLHLYPSNNSSSSAASEVPQPQTQQQQPLTQLQQLLGQQHPQQAGTAHSQPSFVSAAVAQQLRTPTTNQQLQQAFQQALLGNNNDIVTGSGNHNPRDDSNASVSDNVIKGDAMKSTNSTPSVATKMDHKMNSNDGAIVKLDEEIQVHSV